MGSEAKFDRRFATSEIKISCVVQADDAEKAVRVLHAEFKMDEK